MSLLGQILVSIITIIPIPLFLAITQAVGHVTLPLVLVLQSIASIVVFFVLFLKFGVKIDGQRIISEERWFISSFIIIGASVFEWKFFSLFVSLSDMIFNSRENEFIITIIFVYLILIIVCSVLCSHYLYRATKKLLIKN